MDQSPELYSANPVVDTGIVSALDARQSLHNGEFVPYFQPVVTLHTGKLAGFEILARWHHPTVGMIMPDQFILQAERDGWVGLLTEKLLEKAFAATLPAPLSLAINISTVQLRDMRLPTLIREAAEHAAFSLNRLVIEITETALTESVEFALTVTQELKAMGCRLALDDFGTGYSSLLQLQQLPFDEIKVDRTFVSSMTERRNNRKIVAAVIGLGQSLGLTTVAEGVETQEQAEMLQWLGCDFGQGWFYGRPIPVESLADILLASEQWQPARVSPPQSNGSTANNDAPPSQRLAHLQAVYDGAPVGLGLLDCDMRYVNLNTKLADMNGASVADHLGSSVEEMVPELFPNVEEYLQRALEGEAISGVEAIVPATSTSSEETRLVSYQPALDEAGEVVGVSVAVVDITERKLAEETLRETEEHYRNMVELNPQVLWVMDPNGRNLDLSPRWEKSGLLKEHGPGHGWLDDVHPNDVRSTVNNIAAAMRQRVPIRVEYRARKREGGWRWMRSRGAPRFDASGKIVCWYGCVEDIDDLRETEKVLLATEAKLRAATDGVPATHILNTAQAETLRQARS